MAKPAYVIPKSPKRPEPETGPVKRNSTGNSGIQINEQKTAPKQLRASTSSCHDVEPKASPPVRNSTSSSRIQSFESKGIRSHLRDTTGLCNNVPKNPKKIKPKSGPLRRNSIGNSGFQVTESKTAVTNDLRASTGSCYGVSKKIEPTTYRSRRNSTGNSNIQICEASAISNHFRASKGACSDIPKCPEKIEPKAGLLRRNSIGNSGVQIIQTKAILSDVASTDSCSDSPKNTKKLGPTAGNLRRNSTGSSRIELFEANPIPNYLRASTGSCHDICKYGIRNDRKTISRTDYLDQNQDENTNRVRGEKAMESNKGKKAQATKSASKQPLRTDASTTHQSAVKQPNRTFLKSRKYTRSRRKDGVKEIRTSKISKTNSFRSFGKKGPVKKPETEETSPEDVPEKIIHVIEPNDENRSIFIGSSSIENQEMDPPAENMLRATRVSRVITSKESGSSSTGNQEMDPPAENILRATRVRRVITPKESDSSHSRMLKFRRGKVLEMKHRHVGCREKKSLRRVASGVESTDMDDLQRRNAGLMNIVIGETATRLVRLRKSKVEALVGAFQSVINLQDSESPRTSSTAS